MADAFDKVRQGQPLKLSARTWNELIDAARTVQELRPVFAQIAKQQWRDADTIKVRNGTCDNLARFSVVGLDWSTIDPATNLTEWKNAVSIDFEKPDASKHAGRFAILIEPVQTCLMGSALLSGVVPCQVLVTDAAHEFATPITGQTGYLASAHAGAAQILWRQPGTGTKWAVVRLSNHAEPTTTTPEPTTTTTAPDPLGTSTTFEPCSGRCKWTWSIGSALWVLATDGCGNPTTTAAPTTTSTTTTSTTTTTGDPATSTTTTTCCPFNTTTTTTTGEPTTTTTTGSATTTTPC